MSNLNNHVSALIYSYDCKIADCDKIIDGCRKIISRNRNNEDIDLESTRIDLIIEQAKRQAYVQAKYDIDSMLDFI